MKKALLAGAAICALTVGAQAADVTMGPVVMPQTTVAPPISGDLSLFAGFFSYSDNSPSQFSGSIIGGVGRANVWLGPNFSAQFDLNAENFFDQGGDEDYSVVNLAVHVSHRNPNNLIGAFGSIGYQGWWGERFATIGVEGMAIHGSTHFYGQLGYSTDITDSAQTKAWYVHGEARHFFNPNFMLAANLGFAGSNEFGTYHPLLRWGLDAEVKLNNSPFGFFASYRGDSDKEPSEGETATTHSGIVGLKLHFNNNSLEAASSGGATLKDLNPFTGVNHVPYYDNI